MFTEFVDACVGAVKAVLSMKASLTLISRTQYAKKNSGLYERMSPINVIKKADSRYFLTID
jgi:hypothetical protein